MIHIQCSSYPYIYISILNDDSLVGSSLTRFLERNGG